MSETNPTNELTKRYTETLNRYVARFGPTFNASTIALTPEPERTSLQQRALEHMELALSGGLPPFGDAVIGLVSR